MPGSPRCSNPCSAPPLGLRNILQRHRLGLRFLIGAVKILRQSLATAKQRWELFAQQSDSEEQRYQGLRNTLQQKQSEYEKLAQKKAEYEQEIAENLHYIQQEQVRFLIGAVKILRQSPETAG